MFMEIRNIAIIAHVDHGKTTITDAILRQTGMVTDESVSMDSNALEKERGITIYSKNTSIFYKDTKVNIVDTPGHADFGSEVERVLRSIDNVLLVVDAQEGPMPQTRFVLKKSLELGLKPIVVLNKIDKPAADPDMAQEKVFELFLDLGATDEQLDFTVVYAIGKQGIAKLHIDDDAKDLTALLDTILEKVHPVGYRGAVAAKAAIPQGKPATGDPNAKLRAQPFNLGYDNFLGRLAVARIYDGKIKTGQTLTVKKLNGQDETGKVTKLYTFEGTNRKEVEEAGAGDIAMIAGFSKIEIGETICEDSSQAALPAISIDEPTIALRFLVNDSPFAGREGKFVTGQQIRERLEKELEINVGLKIDFSTAEYFSVSGRGELHIAILLENMRREGYEVQVSQPQVIIKEVDGIKSEPFEEVTVDVPTEMSGAVIETLGKRKGIMVDMAPHGSQTRMIFEIPTRGLLGYRGQFVVDTKGEGILCSRVVGFRPYVGEIKRKDVGSMVSMASGKALGFSLANLQERGILYIAPAAEVYEGMVIGNVTKGEEMAVNPTKGKQMSNMRSSGADEAIHLVPPMNLSIERGLEVMNEDEYLEVTPAAVRLRKQYLTENERVRAGRKK
ncbi:MAG: GTP-binding protein [Patescibacteria group bacterium]|nr:GTP-binding protein [Patescibacteria group bacterium]